MQQWRTGPRKDGRVSQKSNRPAHPHTHTKKSNKIMIKEGRELRTGRRGMTTLQAPQGRSLRQSVGSKGEVRLLKEESRRNWARKSGPVTETAPERRGCFRSNSHNPDLQKRTLLRVKGRKLSPLSAIHW